jgi:hypothetical protein
MSVSEVAIPRSCSWSIHSPQRFNAIVLSNIQGFLNFSHQSFSRIIQKGHKCNYDNSYLVLILGSLFYIISKPKYPFYMPILESPLLYFWNISMNMYCNLNTRKQNVGLRLKTTDVKYYSYFRKVYICRDF